MPPPLSVVEGMTVMEEPPSLVVAGVGVVTARSSSRISIVVTLGVKSKRVSSRENRIPPVTLNCSLPSSNKSLIKATSKQNLGETNPGGTGNAISS